MASKLYGSCSRVTSLSLYGHPLAGLYWEDHCRKAILKCGFEPVLGWECLYKHYSKKLFLSIYVDDFKMAGLQKNLKPIWADLRKYLDLDPETSLHGGVYLGCGQYCVKNDDKLIREKTELYETISKPGNATAPVPEAAL